MLVGLARSRAEFNQYLKSPILALPLTALVGAATTMAAPALASVGIAQHGGVQLALGIAFSMAIGYAGGLAAAEDPLNSTKHQRGALVEQKPAPAPTRSRARSKGGRITLAGTAVAAQDETKHFKLIGTTGTGKSTAIREMLNAALARGDRAVIADPDGGYLDRFYDPDRGDIVLNPFDERSMKWNLYAEITSPYDVDQLARALIPDHEGADRSWRGYARTFFSAVTRQTHEAGQTDMAELYRLMVVAEPKELRALVRGTPAQPCLDEHNSRMFDSIRSVTSSAVGALDYIAQQTAPEFSVREWVSKGSTGVLFIPYKAGQIATLRSTISGWMRLAIFEAMNGSEQRDEPETEHPRRLWFVVDELDALGQIDGLKDALARLRKFGGRCVLGFQSIAQVSSTYGQGDAHTIVENCANTLIFRCSSSEGGGTARFASQLIGEREVLRTTVSRSRRFTEMMGSISHNEHLNVEPAVLPSQIEQLPDLNGYLKYASDPQWRRVRLDAVRTWQDNRLGRAPIASAEMQRQRVAREGSPDE
jgi:type IV secretory pathway TraG/TraD family ATPase VirD4